MIRTQIQLEEEDFKRVREAAARAGLSFSAYVRQSLQAALAETERDALRDEAAALVGKYRSGVADLARHHDQYLNSGW